MRVLELQTPHMEGPDVERWQNFLVGQRIEVEADSNFGDDTKEATIEFQLRHGLEPDGRVGNKTYGQAQLLGFVLIEDPTNDSRSGPNWPPLPDFPPLRSTADRERIFGRFEYRHEPVRSDPDNIRILGDWASRNIVRITIPQLRGIEGARADGATYFHRTVVDQVISLWSAWERAGLLGHILTWEGSFVPRFMRGARRIRENLSNHAFGTAFDINYAWNRYGHEPARLGRRGSVRELVPIAHEHGFYWGGHFSRRPDGMHFEVARIL